VFTFDFGGRQNEGSKFVFHEIFLFLCLIALKILPSRLQNRLQKTKNQPEIRLIFIKKQTLNLSFKLEKCLYKRMDKSFCHEIREFSLIGSKKPCKLAKFAAKLFIVATLVNLSILGVANFKGKRKSSARFTLLFTSDMLYFFKII
jgi:hypothetical protein